MAWVQTSWPVHLGLLHDLQVVLLDVALREVEVHLRVKHLGQVVLGLEVHCELVTVHEQVFAITHAVDNLLSKFFQSVLLRLLAYRDLHCLGRERQFDSFVS